MDDLQVARLALDAVRTAARIAEQEQRRRERNRRQAMRDQGLKDQGVTGRAPKDNDADDRNAARRQPEFEMPSNSDGEIPDEFLPRM
jgi:hypothetical protein